MPTLQTNIAWNIDITALQSTDETSVINNVQQLLQQAVLQHVSDIHFEPAENIFRIRFRIDGILQEIMTLPISFAPRIIACLKIMARLDIAERRLPQDGRFRLSSMQLQNIDFRLNTCPTIHGEKAVARILDKSKNTLMIETLGFTEMQKQLFLSTLTSPQGMILVTGPTGSGKTVTLYSALTVLNKNTVNISTIEDPVEIHLPGINQINIHPKSGLDFATVLRALLRQDPDIIMVGEIRDAETAEIAIQAAQTGHLVFSTLHTNNAAETLLRFSSMKIPAYHIASAISLIIAQRLARLLCPDCKQKKLLPKSSLKELGFNDTDLNDLTLYTAVGCKKCHQGYKGRIAIYECLPINQSLREMIVNGAHAHTISHYAQTQGMLTLHAAGLLKVKMGLTSLQELRRVIRE